MTEVPFHPEFQCKCLSMGFLGEPENNDLEHEVKTKPETGDAPLKSADYIVVITQQQPAGSIYGPGPLAGMYKEPIFPWQPYYLKCVL